MDNIQNKIKTKRCIKILLISICNFFSVSIFFRVGYLPINIKFELKCYNNIGNENIYFGTTKKYLKINL